jgi:hypothetical protein
MEHIRNASAIEKVYHVALHSLRRSKTINLAKGVSNEEQF